MTAAIRNYLEIRKSSGLGAATVTEIYRAIRDGGYKFEAKSEEIAQIGVGNALRKTSSVFHRLPNGQYGLLGWYPSAKAVDGHESKSSQKRKAKKPRPEKSAESESDNAATNKEIREVVLAQNGNFKVNDIEGVIRSAYPAERSQNKKISTVIFILKQKGLVKVVTERSGKTGRRFYQGLIIKSLGGR